MSPLDQPPPLRNSDLDAALAEAHEAYTRARPKSAAIHAKAREVMPGGNTRTVLFYTPFPTAMVRGEGCRLWDADGREYLDLLGEYTAGLFGHSERRILDAVKGALDRGVNLAAVGEKEAQLASLIVGRFPSVEMVRFTNSGTEANLMALAASRGFTGRVKTMVMRGGYHGGVLTFASEKNPVNVPIPLAFTDYNDPAAAARDILAEGDQLAAVLVEPMLGSGGCIPATREFLQALRDATRQTGAVLIFDEVMTSRHSAGGLQTRQGVIPDMTTLGKYMAGGMSFGAFGGRRDIMAVFDGHRPGTLPHAGTFNNNVWSMAAGCVAMGEIFDAAAAEALWVRGEALRLALNGVARRAGVAMQFTGLGSMVNVHFRGGAITGPYKASPAEDKLRELFFFDMLAQGIYLARRGMAALSLPVTDADCARYVAAVEEFVAARKPLLGAA
ncbi:aminotransferase class III-fold pyridoxal phosphate-dependent enzyme [Siccirubricoccus sp. KC 17139]|uniref:Aminotransferase class III-fold pyridoxal phosphate-dependent enzyme n=1 Tax=Siccirubricoccus soli TaxID=2899147 RepID=A0ABT1DA40_9PROT|nr:aminotransferase class III-fold pyridoxal phosphate-dependent enzyme [Siccirubricoccus soli]MCO6418472.1 aminotransferase class III-fold pyridoxal phosphate-dependent enzyme [Siccirubricoccus soli]MCP2684607.1 aminotransferase class III-fold pyridoxal phosphate-dependent enzyme [Siccirubricoccus soli]